MTHARRLTLAHLWVAFAAFAVAAVLGVWQMWARSPLPAPFLTAQTYFTSVTAHGASMAYVLTTFLVMGFGYFVAETALGRPLPGPRLGLARLSRSGSSARVMAVVTIFAGQRVGALHLLPAAHREPVLLHRPRAGRRRARGSGADRCSSRWRDWKRANPGRAGAARDVRDRRQRGHVAVDDGRGRGGAAVPGHSRPRSAGPRRVDVGLSRTLFSVDACTRSSISGCSRPTSPSTRWRRRRRAGGSTATRWAG